MITIACMTLIVYTMKLQRTMTLLNSIMGITLVITILAYQYFKRSIDSVTEKKPAPSVVMSRSFEPDHLISKLPLEIAGAIFSNLKLSDLGAICKVRGNWNQVVNAPSLSLLWKKAIYDQIAFGRKRWAEVSGETLTAEEMEEDYNSLPDNIGEILKRPCPVFSGKVIGETHVLVRICRTINGKPFCKKTLGELVKKYFPDSKPHGYNFIYSGLLNGKHDEPVDESYWVLMTKDVLPKSNSLLNTRSYPKQQAMVADLKEKSKCPYEVPQALEAIACIFAEFLRSKTYLFQKKVSIWAYQGLPYAREAYTCCKESSDGNQLLVGGFSSRGLEVMENYFRDIGSGVAAVWKL